MANRNRYVRSGLEHSTEAVRIEKTAAGSRSQRRLRDQLEGEEGLSLPTLQLNPTLLVEGSPGTSNGNIDLPVFAQPVMVPGIVGISSRNSDINTSSEESLDRRRREPTPAVLEQFVSI